MIIWLTGQPGAGKTTIAKELEFAFAHKDNVTLIDGDDLREIFPGTGFTREERYKNIRRAQDIAKFLDWNGHLVIVSLVAPYRELREELKASAFVVEAYVHTTDIRGREKFHVADYEQPLTNFIDIDTTNKTIKSCADQIIEALKGKI
jgi:adenylylsulfate kinase